MDPLPTVKLPPSAQIEPAKKAAALKAANEATRLLIKPQVCAIAGVTYPTLWKLMREGVFPRARVVGGRSMWRSDEIDQWLAGLPIRRLKGDTEADRPLDAA